MEIGTKSARAVKVAAGPSVNDNGYPQNCNAVYSSGDVRVRKAP